MGDPATPSNVRDRSRNGSLGLLQRLVSACFGSDDPDRVRNRLLKQIGKDLHRQRYKFYKPKSREAQPGLARLFYEIYRVVAPAKALLQGADQSAALRTIVIEANQSEEQQRHREELSESTIRERSEQMSSKALAEHLKSSILAYTSGFDSVTSRQINDTYALVNTLINFVKYDYYFVLRKFDASLPESDFTYAPRFETINAQYVGDDIKDFLEVAIPLERDIDWEQIFDILHEYRGVDVVDRAAWKKVCASVANIVGSGVLVKIVQHIDSEPRYVPEVRTHRKQVVESYLSTLKTQVEASIQRLARERRTKKLERLVLATFGTTDIHRAKHYTEAANLVYTKKKLAGFLHIDAVNYLKAFLVDYFKRDVRMVVSDVLIVRGEWSDNVLSQQLSDSYYAVMSAAQQIVEFDDSLGEEGPLGIKLRKAAGRVIEREPGTAKQLSEALRTVNETALGMVHETASHLIRMGNVLKALIEDLEKERPELIHNWKQLQGFVERPVRDELVAIYKRAYHFVQLMQVSVKR